MTMWLIGMMGAGKSTCGSRAAAALGIAFQDTDQVIAEDAGRTLAQVWDEVGESGFRDLERAVVSRLAGGEAIVATGGGVVIDPENRAAMTGSGRVIWLDAPPGVLLERIGEVGGRPLLESGVDPLRAITELLADRERWYRDLADAVIDTRGRSVDEVAAEIEAQWAG